MCPELHSCQKGRMAQQRSRLIHLKKPTGYDIMLSLDFRRKL